MKNGNKFIVLLFLSFYSIRLSSQTNCTVPQSPVLTLVSVNPATGFTELRWTPSPSTGIAGYIVYTYHNEGGVPRGDVIDTIWDPQATTFIYQSTVNTYYSTSYVVAAHRIPNCTSPFSNVISTIFTKPSIDTCNKKILVKWNSYQSQPVRVTGYSVLYSVNGSAFSEAGNAGPADSTFTITTFASNANYCFIVRANLEGGSFSTSNKACLSTEMQSPPEWINADYATVNEKNTIDLSFTIDPLSEINRFRLERRVEDEADFSTLAGLVSTGNKVSFTDETADPLKTNYYRLLAINNCANPVLSSNLANNIVAVLKNESNVISLKWGFYDNWLGDVSGYKVYINTGGGFHEEAIVPPGDSSYFLNYSSLMFEITDGKLCFYVAATEADNPFGVSGSSNSSIVCTDIIENIFVPNAFTPNGDLMNDLFRPVLSFVPVNYTLVITDRWNNVLFESQDPLEAWDGMRNGEEMQRGLYLWFLKTKTPSGRQISKSGTVTIIK